MKIYLASGFFDKETRHNVEVIARALRSEGHEVYVPMEHEIKNAWSYPNKEWGKKVFEEDVRAIRNSDMVVMIDYGMNNDSGASWECGFAYGIGKPCKVIPMDKVISLMVACSCINLKELDIEIK